MLEVITIGGESLCPEYVSLEWFQDKYGQVDGEKKYRSRSDEKRNDAIKSKIWLHASDGPAWSKVSQELFWNLYQRVSGRFRCIYFGELNHEYSCGTNRNFDFVVVDTKRVIEFNGLAFHPKPGIAGGKWRQVYTNKTVSEVEEMDRNKMMSAVQNGYSFYVVWEDDYIASADGCVGRCLEFLGVVNDER